MRYWTLVAIMTFFIAGAVQAEQQPASCTYSTYQWNVNEKRAVNYRVVEKPYQQLTASEVDANTGCSVCQEDQVTIELPGVETFQICHLFAQSVTDTLIELQKHGQQINSVTGYRVGMTRGNPDPDGNRTGFSNHSFGIALDINAEHNGLYGNCLSFGSQCQLRRGGHWQPGHEASLTADSPTVVAMKGLGFKWGGEIQGWQKDFMHFSLTGY